MLPLRDVNPTRVTPLITVALIAANVLVFLFWQPISGTEGDQTEFLYEYAAIACELSSGDPLSIAEFEADRCDVDDDEIFPNKQVYLAALVSMFLHGGWAHLIGNMWFLWIFGNNVEEAFGYVGYLALYAVAGVAATATFVLLNADSTIPLVGASGAIAGVLGAYLVLFPQHRILTLVILFIFPLVVGVPALFFLGLWFVGQFLVVEPGVAVEAHIAGFVVGMTVAALLRPLLLRRTSEAHQVGTTPGHVRPLR